MPSCRVQANGLKRTLPTEVSPTKFQTIDPKLSAWHIFIFSLFESGALEAEVSTHIPMSRAPSASFLGTPGGESERLTQVSRALKYLFLLGTNLAEYAVHVL